jgi:hypothetical protein
MAQESFISHTGTIDVTKVKLDKNTSEIEIWPWILRLGPISVFLTQDDLDKLVSECASQELEANR